MSDQERMDGPELVPKLVPDLGLAEFELQLARAMRRVDAPEGFADRIMERSASPVETVIVMRPRSGLWRMQAWAGGAIAAALVLGTFGAEQLHQRREQAKADQQFAVAMQVTDHALAQTREQLQRAGLNLGE
jgi:glycogen debranching enzyme